MIFLGKNAGDKGEGIRRVALLPPPGGRRAGSSSLTLAARKSMVGRAGMCRGAGILAPQNSNDLSLNGRAASLSAWLSRGLAPMPSRPGDFQ
jgi:hypothetical protein